MAATVLIVEMIIIGFQTLIGFLLVVLTFWHPTLQGLSDWKDFSTPISLAVVGICYSIGLIIDSFTAVIEDKFEFLLFPLSSDKGGKEKRNKERRELRQKLRFLNRDLYADLDKDQYHLRLFRSTIFNILLIFISLAFFLYQQKMGCTVMAIYFFSALLTLSIAFIGWKRRRKSFEKNRDCFYDALKNELEEKHKS